MSNKKILLIQAAVIGNIFLVENLINLMNSDEIQSALITAIQEEEKNAVSKLVNAMDLEDIQAVLTSAIRGSWETPQSL